MNEVISIHAPRTGSDNSPRHAAVKSSNFNPRSPHGERQAEEVKFLSGKSISIHAPRTGSDARQPGLRRRGEDFNPRSPHGERRVWVSSRDGAGKFQSTLPARGATTRVSTSRSTCTRFQSTLPARGATLSRAFRRAHIVISIHAPRTGSDCAECLHCKSA